MLIKLLVTFTLIFIFLLPIATKQNLFIILGLYIIKILNKVTQYKLYLPSLSKNVSCVKI